MIYTLPKQLYRLSSQDCPPWLLKIADLPIKTVHPVQSVLPKEPRPPASTGIDSNAPMVCASLEDVAVTKGVEVNVDDSSGNRAPNEKYDRA
jgi:hypothetical protein